MSEANFMRRVMLAAPKVGVMLYRNNVGMCRADDGRIVTFGLCKGSSDLIGWTMRDGVAIFTAVETKTRRGRLTREQQNFLDAVNRDGGRGLVLREGDNIEEVLKDD